MIYDCIVIGAGAAGLFFGSTITKRINGLILEKTSRAGSKLLISGSGQCNITHSGSIKDFVRCYGKNGGRIRSCLYRHSNRELMDFLESNGVATTTREDGKIFPASMNANDIRKLLLRKCEKNGFSINYNESVCAIESHDSDLWRISTYYTAGKSSGKNINNLSNTISKSYISKTVVIASGGCSYPATGSDGSLFSVLKKYLDINITPLKPALAPLKVYDYPYVKLAGISFAHAGVSIWRGHKSSRRKISENAAGLLFTHKDLSGPAVLNISQYAEQDDTIMINYLYPMGYEDALKAIKEAISNSSCDMSNIISARFNLPKRFCRLITDRYGLSPKTLALRLTSEEFTVSSPANFSKAMVTNGGIDLNEINTKTMEIKKHPGIFSVGEVCDIDGITGGYNLQFAYSSARTAGEEIII